MSRNRAPIAVALLLLHTSILSTLQTRLEAYLALSVLSLAMLYFLGRGLVYPTWRRDPYVLAAIAIFMGGVSLGLLKGFPVRDITRDALMGACLVTAYLVAINSTKTPIAAHRLDKLVVTVSLLTVPLFFWSAIEGLRSATSVWEYRTLYVPRFSALYVFPFALLTMRLPPGNHVFGSGRDLSALVLLGIAILLSLSRTDYVIVVVLTGIVALRLVRYRRRAGIRLLKIASVLLPMVVLAISLESVRGRLGSLSVGGADTSVGWRMVELSQMWTVMRDGPWWTWAVGHGLGYRMPLAEPQVLAGRVYETIPLTHNSYQFFLLKSGLVGLIGLVLPLVWMCWRGVRSSRLFCAEAAVIIAVVLLKGFTMMGLNDPGYLIVVGLYIGLYRRFRVGSLRENSSGWRYGVAA